MHAHKHTNYYLSWAHLECAITHPGTEGTELFVPFYCRTIPSSKSGPEIPQSTLAGCPAPSGHKLKFPSSHLSPQQKLPGLDVLTFPTTNPAGG
jgi:hypothetical protein